ncbi:hypothetical protein HRbin36_00722 [bacterium HR36]|nr:hypothetical protein HRbin36_00722 [bacterium HR36]
MNAPADAGTPANDTFRPVRQHDDDHATHLLRRNRNHADDCRHCPSERRRMCSFALTAG